MPQWTVRRSCLALVACLLASPLGAQITVRVPEDESDLQDAIDRVRLEGGTIVLAAGTYPAPSGGFRVRHTREDMTIRAATGATVVLDGLGTRTILRFDNDDPTRSERVTFRGLTFRNGRSSSELVAGAVTLLGAEATFVNCRFESSSSQAPTTGGGGVLISQDSDVLFLDSSFTGNTAKNRGGGMEILFSRVEIQGGSFEGNRVNLPGHAVNAVGGGIYVLDSRLRVVDTRFEENQAAWVGGAINVFGIWAEPLAKPRAEVEIFGAAFVANKAEVDACCSVPGGTSGGAVHVEDHASVRIYRSLFEGNEAELGGALDTYRGLVEIHDSVLRGNRSLRDRAPLTAGGTFFVASADFNDASTNFGAIDRRPAELLLEGTLVEGVAGEAAAENGGCLNADGDVNRRFGDGGVAQTGDAASHRAKVTIRQSAFVGCIATGGNQPGAGLGGAINTRLTALTIVDSLFLDNSCTIEDCGGGAISTAAETAVTIADSVFAGNAADRGGALFLAGSTVAIDNATFLDNTISEADAETNIINSRGAAIFAIPGFNGAQPERQVDVTGEVRNSTFSGNRGVPVFDADTGTGPINRVVYNGNRFFSSLFAGKVYVDNAVRAAGETVAELNALVVNRANGVSTDKSTTANVALGSRPVTGKVLATPRRLVLAAGETPPAETFLPFAWSGGTAQLAGQGLGGTRGRLTTTTAGDAALRVDGSTTDTAAVAAASCSIGPLLCLRADRFTMQVDWERRDGLSGFGQGVQLTADTGYYFFFNASNVELVVKALEGCPQNQRFWIFAGGLTNVRTALRVVNTVTGEVNDYVNPQNTPFQPIQDTFAFGGCGVAASTVEPFSAPLEAVLGAAEVLELDNGRFEVRASFRTPRGQQGVGQAVQLTADTGYFFFFNADNVELVVKVLNGCGLNGNYWVFAGGLTNVEVELTVTDTETGGPPKVYTNPLRVPFQPIQDVRAFPNCP